MLINIVKRVVNASLRKLFKVEISRVINETEGKNYKCTKKWNYQVAEKYWIGGKFSVPNFSTGYHGILQQWWEHYNKGQLCLLVSENNKVKEEFQKHYPSWKFHTLDYYDNKGEPVDIVTDLCGKIPEDTNMLFDLIVCQATLEHLYNPFKAMQNMMSLLNQGGVVLLHTHLPTYYYHPYPRDYVRFHPDWFEDIPLFIPEYELLELYTVSGHIFVAYKKIAVL